MYKDIYFNSDNVLMCYFPAEASLPNVKEFMKYYSRYIEENPCISVMIDGSKVNGSLSNEVSKFLINEIRELREPHPKDKVAIVLSLNKFLKISVKTVLTIGQKTHTQIFDSTDEAMDWLYGS